MKFRMYVDEVGNSDLESSDNPNHRFLSLTGVIMDLEHVAREVQPRLEALKSRYFGSHPDDPVVLHRKELVNAAHPFQALAADETRRAFDAELLRFLNELEYTVVTVCIDKKRHKETYQTWRYEPYHYCLAVLLERYVYFLNRRRTKGDVLAESRGGKEDRRLKDSFHRLWKDGTEYLDSGQIQATVTSQQLKVKQKANNIAGLQIADLLAHPSRAEILFENGLRAQNPAPFARRVIEILRGKYDQHGERVFGKKLL